MNPDPSLTKFLLKRSQKLFHDADTASFNSLREVYQLFVNILVLLSDTAGLHFTTIFTRVAYLSQQGIWSKSLAYRANALRIAFRTAVKTEDKSLIEKAFYLGILVVTTALDQLDRDLVPISFMQAVKKKTEALDIMTYSQRKSLGFHKILKGNIIHLDLDNKHFHFLAEDDDKIYTIPYEDVRIESFAARLAILIREVFHTPVAVHLLDTKLETEDRLVPTMIVINPDYLMDISVIAECTAIGKDAPLWYMVNKFLPYESTEAIMLGNVANTFLDELIYTPDIKYADLFKKVFQRYPLVFAGWTDHQVKRLYTDAQRHYITIRTMIKQDFKAKGIDPMKSAVEPSFYSQQHGIQGRLDLLYQDGDQAAIVELKSGKLYRPNRYGLNQSHYYQTLLYDLMISAAYEGRYSASTYILYSRLETDQLKFAPSTKSIQYEALAMRNELVAMDRSLMNIDIASAAQPNVLDLIDDQRIAAFRAPFMKVGLEQFKQGILRLQGLERQYINLYVGFIAREQWHAKMGMEGSSDRSGQSSLWHNSLREKEDQYSILHGLTVEAVRSEAERAIIVFNRTDRSNNLANMRVGDIVILYDPEEVTKDLTAIEAIKGSITTLTTEQVTVKLRSNQINTARFQNGHTWNLEPDLYEHSFAAMYRALLTWGSRMSRKRQLILGQEPPTASSCVLDRSAYPALLDSQFELLQKMLAAEDYFLLWGPPGTGKTSRMLSHAVSYLYAHTSSNVLITAYTNRAVEEICEALQAVGINDYIRLGSNYQSEDEHFLAEKLSSISNRAELVQMLSSHRIYVSTIATANAQSALLDLVTFDRLFVDEASQVLDPYVIGLLSRVEKFILIGDHRQLPAVSLQSPERCAVTDPAWVRLGLVNLTNSLFERLLTIAQTNGWSHVYGMLSEQGRMHEDIMAFPAREFYDGSLKVIPSVQRLRATWQPKTDSIYVQKRVTFVPAKADTSSHSGKKNEYESKLVVEIVQDIIAEWIAQGRVLDKMTIGVITPYRAQIAQISFDLSEALPPEIVEMISVDTVERYQGGARDMIVMSVCANHVRQLDSLVSLSIDEVDRKLNVAITRAKELFIMVGNAAVLGHDRRYKQFIETYHR